MFLNRLIARAKGTARVLKNAPLLAQELGDLAWGPAPEVDLAEPEAAALPPLAHPRRQTVSPRQPQIAEPELDALPATGMPQPSPPSAATPEPIQAAEPTPLAPAQSTAPPSIPHQDLPALRPMPHSEPPLQPQRRAALAEVTPAPPAPPAPQSPPVQPRTEVRATLAQPLPAAAPPLQRDVRPDPAPAVAETSESIEVHVEIGHLDLVSPQPPRARPTPQMRAARPGPSLSLTDYLDRRRRDRG